MMKGMTKAMATVSANGMKRSALNMQAIPVMCRTVRNRMSPDKVARHPQGCPGEQRHGGKDQGLEREAHEDQHASGTTGPRILARLSPSGASTQKPSMRAMPRAGGR